MSKERKTALAYALDCLSRRPFGYAQLDERLRRKSYPAEEREEALRQLTERGYLDDVEYARAFCHSKRRRFSRKSVAFKLVRQGIDKTIAAQAIGAEYSLEEEYRYCREHLLREWDKKPKKSIIDREESKHLFVSRIIRKFVRNGYPYDMVRKILEEDFYINSSSET